MLSARELALEQNPNATGWVNQRISYTHGVGVAMVPVNEVGSEGQPHLLDQQPAAGLGDGRPDDHPAADLLRRAAALVRRHRRPAERVRLPDRRERLERLGRDRDRWTGTTGIDLDTTLMRLLFAARFRDLDLLISDQVTSDSQLLFHRSLPTGCRAGRAVPALRQGSVPRHRRQRPAGLHPGRVHDLGPVPERPGVRSDRSVRHGPRRRRLQLHPQQRQDHDRTPTTARCTSTSRTRTTRSSAPTRASSRRCSSRSRRCRPTSAPTCASPRSCSTSRPGCSGATTSRTPQQFFRSGRPVDRADRHDERADPAVRGVLRRDAAARREGGRVPAPPADGPDQPPEHDRLGRRPERRRELRQVHGLPVPGRHDDLRARPDRGADRPGPGHQRPDLALEPVGQQGHPRQPDRACRSTTPSSTSSRSTCSRPDRRSRSSRGSSSPRRARSSGARRSATRSGCCWRPRRAPRPNPTPPPITGPVRQSGPGQPRRRPVRSARHRRRRWPACRPTCRASSTTPTRTSSSPSRRCATATSPATARRSRSSRPRSSGSRSSPRVSRCRASGPSASPAP